MHQVILEGEAHIKSFGTLFFRPLVAGSSINAVQSLQLEHDGPSNLHNCFPTLAVALSLKLLFFKERIEVLEFQFRQFCSIMTKIILMGSFLY